MAPPDTPTWRMADTLADGTLAEQLLELRASGTSWRRISTVLLERWGIDVTEVTVAGWHRQLSSGDGTEQVPPSPPASPDDLPSRAAR